MTRLGLALLSHLRCWLFGHDFTTWEFPSEIRPGECIPVPTLKLIQHDPRGYIVDTLRSYCRRCLWVPMALLLAGCTTADPSALAAYDRAAAMGLVAPRSERPYVRLNDGAPWTRERRVEISR